MVNDSGASQPALFEEFVASLFRIKRTLRSTSQLWGQAHGGLQRSDVTVLRTLDEHGECRAGFIAETLGVGPSVISRQVAALAEKQYVARRRDPEDGRAELIALTAAGRRRLAAMRAAYIAHMEQQFTDWDDDRIRDAAALLHEISDHLVPIEGRETGRTKPLTNQKEHA